MSRLHPADGVLRAYLDGELSPLARLRCAWHVRGCATCRATLEQERWVERRAAELISGLGADIDVSEGWQRFSARSGGIYARRTLAAWPTVGMAAIALLTVLVLLAPERRREGNAGVPSGVREQDVCCWDLDGGGPGDDGIYTLSRRGQVVACVILYDDVDASRSFSKSDVVRFVSRPGDCEEMRVPDQSRRQFVPFGVTMARAPSLR